jgi:hypothetical protein
MAQPNYKRFSVRRIIGAANLWVTEFILTYDGQPSYTVIIMEFEDEQVIRETQSTCPKCVLAGTRSDSWCLVERSGFGVRCR